MVRVRRRPLALLAIGALTATLTVTPGPAVADAPTGTTSITVFLKAPDPAGLDRLAAASGLSRAQRIGALRTLVPSDQTHATVENSLRQQGFRVTGSTTWSITATGAAANSRVLFGERPAHARSRIAATGALPRVPAALAGVVSAVYPTTGGPAAFRHSTRYLAGSDFRRADTPAKVAPSTGQKDAGAAIATLQLANFYGSEDGFANSVTAADLTTYANEHHLTDPVASGQYRAVNVDGGPSSDDDSTGGDVEVNLDQQSILSTAPTADQRAYFAPNTEAGFDDVFSTVFDDVVSGSENIVAMSSSWGQCESQTGAQSIATIEPILKSLVAAGVTLFASSGDFGIYDCGSGFDGSVSTQADVDYPASSPSVISVGGTRLSATTSAANTGSNWTETAWSCRYVAQCEIGPGGGGGGRSGEASAVSDFAGFAAPAYQRVGIDDRPFAGNAKRLVPDIAADADPATGFVIYSSDTWQTGTNNAPIGGTSLAAPISAAQLVNALCDAGHKRGVGDIHGALYSAYRATRSFASTNPKKVFRDVTKGQNGADNHRASNPSVSAQPGYDTVTGLGAVLWSAVLPYIFDTHRPFSAVTASLPALHTRDWNDVQASWRVSRGSDKRLLGPTLVKITRSGSSTPVYNRGSLPSSNHYTFAGNPGDTYTITVTGQDLAAHHAYPKTATIRVPIDDSRFTASEHWTRTANRYDIGGSHLSTSTDGAAAQVSKRGRVYQLLVDTGPDSGRLGVYLGGRLIKTIDLHSSRYGRASATIFSSRERGLRTFTLRALGSKLVSVDGLYVTA